MNINKIIFTSTVFLIASALYSCKKTESEKNSAQSINSIRGLYKLSEISCQGKNVDLSTYLNNNYDNYDNNYDDYNAINTVSDSINSLVFDFSTEKSLITIKKPTEPITCKYYERLDFVSNPDGKVAFVSNAMLRNDKANHAVCKLDSNRSFLAEKNLNDSFNVKVTGNKIILVSSTENLCKSFKSNGKATISLSMQTKK
ncbi:hypothetical protein [Fluviispira sanaruensis]|uniref:Uncharacterized protein n=1 Tax=Fluviispira sanaruensis TaxID=2493639 RepID=A0A4P2VRF6_FLUSA|nr:hypothetical protein [Fluviispira sanaruensis]BBH51635.1 hypothetical protein JCM31447_00520 [Fluviispira sanaruensis]